MAQVNMNDRLSFVWNEIRAEIQNGQTVTHILKVETSQQQNADEGVRIRQKVFEYIRNTPITKIVDGQQVTITWRTRAEKLPSWYHCNSGLFNDIAVKKHTILLLRDVLNQLDNQFNRTFSWQRTGLAFLVLKPLVREVVLVDDDDNINVLDAAGNDNDFDEQYQQAVENY